MQLLEQFKENSFKVHVSSLVFLPFFEGSPLMLRLLCCYKNYLFICKCCLRSVTLFYHTANLFDFAFLLPESRYITSITFAGSWYCYFFWLYLVYCQITICLRVKPFPSILLFVCLFKFPWNILDEYLFYFQPDNKFISKNFGRILLAQ